jgi:hypothetical protein
VDLTLLGTSDLMATRSLGGFFGEVAKHTALAIVQARLASSRFSLAQFQRMVSLLDPCQWLELMYDSLRVKKA